MASPYFFAGTAADRNRSFAPNPLKFTLKVVLCNGNE
jgi:hypothetical protein